MASNSLYDSTEKILKYINKYTDIRIQYLKESYKNYDYSFDDKEYESMTKRIREYIISHVWKDLCIYTIWEGDELASIGFLNIQNKVPHFFIQNGRYGLVNGLFTYEKYRCKGYASKILEMMQKDAKSLGLNCIELNSVEGKSGFYEKFNFYNSDKLEHMEWYRE